MSNDLKTRIEHFINTLDTSSTKRTDFFNKMKERIEAAAKGEVFNLNSFVEAVNEFEESQVDEVCWNVPGAKQYLSHVA